MIKQSVLLAELPSKHISHILDHTPSLPLCKMGFLKRCGKITIDNKDYFVKELNPDRVNVFKGNYLELRKK